MEPLATDSFVVVLFGREIPLSYNPAERHNLMPHNAASVPFIKHLLLLNLKFDAPDPWYDEIEPNPPYKPRPVPVVPWLSLFAFCECS
jgi:hypothetical protein